MVPDIVVSRLPIYLRALEHMVQRGQPVTSSQELGKVLGITAAQIRKDLSYFGEFGKQGKGYRVETLVEELRQILNLKRVWDIAVVGAGDIGSAVARYQGLVDRGFQVVMLFDNDPTKIGSQVGPFTVRDSGQLIKDIQSASIQVAIIATPADVAQQVAEQLIQAGIKAILNYAPISLSTPPGVHVQNVDPAIHLQRMTFYLD